MQLVPFAPVCLCLSISPFDVRTSLSGQPQDGGVDVWMCARATPPFEKTGTLKEMRTLNGFCALRDFNLFMN